MIQFVPNDDVQKRCYFCGNDIPDGENEESVVTLYRQVNMMQFITAEVHIDQCPSCNSKIKRGTYIAIAITVLSAIGVFIGLAGTDLGFFTIIGAGMATLFLGVIEYFGMMFTFRYAYNIWDDSHPVVKLMKDQYGWQSDEPKQGDKFSAFGNDQFNEMIQTIQRQYGYVFRQS